MILKHMSRASGHVGAAFSREIGYQAGYRILSPPNRFLQPGALNAAVSPNRLREHSLRPI